jgi:hypothetical protein
MALRYVVAPDTAMRTLDFSWVKEDSWDTTRWATDRRSAIIHWESTTEDPNLTTWLRNERIDRQVADKNFMNNYTRVISKSAWENQPTPPPRP